MTLTLRELGKINDLEIRHKVFATEEALLRVESVIRQWSWLAEGRGPYAYDDPHYDEDVRRMYRELVEAARKL